MKRLSRKKNIKKTLTNMTSKTTIDNKLTAEALLLELMLEYGINLEDRIICLTGEVNDNMYDIFEVGMAKMESQSKATITVKINSPGGSTYSAMGIIGRLTESKCRVITKGYGHVMSAATLILASGDKRLMSTDAFFMWHEASYDVSGRHSENKALVAQVEREEKLWAEKMAERSNESAEHWTDNGIGIDAYFSAEELKELEVVDELF